MQRKEKARILERGKSETSTFKSIELIINPDGSIVCDWWSKELDEILEELGIPKTDWRRNPWCG